jgi:2-keto-3-deoxy-L-fuconate dehydrogenase
MILTGKRILITQANAFMGSSLCEVFTEQGATVIANEEPLADPQAPAKLIEQVGEIDVLVANLALAAPSTPAEQVTGLAYDASAWFG